MFNISSESRNKIKILFLVFFIASFFLFTYNSCLNSDANKSDSSIDSITVTVHRFDRDMFVLSELKNISLYDTLKKLYPYFAVDYFANILGLSIVPGHETEMNDEVKRFVNSYKELRTGAPISKINFSQVELELAEGFKNVKRNYSKYRIPKVVSFIAPIDAVFGAWHGQTVDILSDSIIGISVFGHLVNDLIVANKKIVYDLYPEYMMRKFNSQSISASCFKLIAEDLHKDNSASKNLITQIVEKGKLLYFVKKMLPNVPDSILFSYTNEQINACTTGEDRIWKLLLQDNHLYSKDYIIIRNFIGDAPFTKGLPNNYPGYIGLWMGYQIVKSYISQHEKKSLKSIMKLDGEKLFKASNYKPNK